MTDTSLRNRVAIVGVGESEIGKIPHMTGLGLNAQAAKRALGETGLKPSEIDGLLTAYSMQQAWEYRLGSVWLMRVLKWAVKEMLGMFVNYNAGFTDVTRCC